MKKFCAEVETFFPDSFSSLYQKHYYLKSLLTNRPYSVYLRSSHSMASAIKTKISSTNFDIVHLDTIDLVQCVENLDHKRIVLNHHNIESSLLDQMAHFLPYGPMRIFAEIQAKKMLSYETKWAVISPLNLVVSDSDGELLKKISPSVRYAIIPNGVDPEYFKPSGGPEDDFSLTHISTLDWWPNVDAILHFYQSIWPIIKRKVPQAVINLAGKSISPKILALGKKDPDFKVHGFVPDIRPLLDRSAVYVVPLRIGGGTRLKILDAMAMGKAIVSTSKGCEGLSLTDGQEILIADSPLEFAEKVAWLINNPEKRKTIGAHARQKVISDYNWEKISLQLSNAYENLFENV